MVACAFVYRRNQYRESLVVEDALTGRNSGIGGGGEGGEGHFGQRTPSHSTSQAAKTTSGINGEARPTRIFSR